MPDPVMLLCNQREDAMCVVCYVDEDMKDKIIAYGAEFQ